VNRAIGEVHDLFRMAEREHAVRAVRGVVARVRGGGRVAQAQRDLHVPVPWIEPANPPLPTTSSLPFQLSVGIHSSL
jgi:hypothetical protein